MRLVGQEVLVGLVRQFSVMFEARKLDTAWDEFDALSLERLLAVVICHVSVHYVLLLVLLTFGLLQQVSVNSPGVHTCYSLVLAMRLTKCVLEARLKRMRVVAIMFLSPCVWKVMRIIHWRRHGTLDLGLDCGVSWIFLVVA